MTFAFPDRHEGLNGGVNGGVNELLTAIRQHPGCSLRINSRKSVSSSSGTDVSAAVSPSAAAPELTSEQP
ncbi:hypothetical protein E0L29_03410 [Chlorobium sp. N1]|nr:hypothetical protein E0L29_03410 [Chlorobium sp. N1]